jgi:hypothetical protein
MKPRLELIYRAPDRSIHRKFITWRRPCTDVALAEYIEDYLELVREGYRPAGFESPPLPHCARVHHLGKVLAEWNQRFSPRPPAESLVTAAVAPGPGEIPAMPRTPSSDPGLSGRPDGSQSLEGERAPFAIPQRPHVVNNASSSGEGVDFGQPVAQAGHPWSKANRTN